jgi:hypothetical protein
MEAYEELLSRGVAVPEDFLSPPELPPMSQVFLEAFWDLSTERSIGMSVGAIPLSRVLVVAEWYGLDEDNTRTLFQVVRVLDRLYLAQVNKDATS